MLATKAVPLRMRKRASQSRPSVARSGGAIRAAASAFLLCAVALGVCNSARGQQSEGAQDPGPQLDAAAVAGVRQKFDEILAVKGPPLKPGVLIVPALTPNRLVRDDGLAVSAAAQLASAYAPHKLTDIAVSHVQEVIRRGKFGLPRRPLSDEDVAIIVASAGVKNWAIPILSDDGKGLHLTLHVYGADEALGDSGKRKTFEHDLSDVTRAPGQIATDVLDFAGVELSAEQSRSVTQVQVRSAEAMRLLSLVLLRNPLAGFDEQIFSGVWSQNPRSLLAWDHYLRASRFRIEGCNSLLSITPPLECDHFALTMAPILASHGQVDRALALLLERAPTLHADGDFLASLASVAMEVDDEELFDRVLEHWRKLDDGPAAQRRRAGLLLEFSSLLQRKSSSWPAIHQRCFALCGEARDELVKSIESEPLAFLAHIDLVRCARTLELDEAFAKNHFSAAIAIDPAATDAYSERFLYLSRNSGDHPDRLIDFAWEAAQKPWSCQAPIYAIHAINQASIDPKTRERRGEVFQHDGMWRALEELLKNARATKNPAIEQYVRHVVALWGAYGGHLREVQDDFARLGDFTAPIKVADQRFYPILADVFDVFGRNGAWEYRPNAEFLQHYQALVESEYGVGAEKLFDKVRVALDAADFNQAERVLDELQHSGTRQTERIKRLRRVALQCRTLSEKGKLELSPEEFSETWCGNSGPRGRVEDGKVTLFNRLEFSSPFGLSNVEFSAEMEWSDSPYVFEMHLRTGCDAGATRVVYNAEREFVSLDRNYNNVGWKPCSLRGGFPLRVHIVDGEDRVELPSGEVVQAPRRGNPVGGIRMYVNLPGGLERPYIRIHSVTIRRLDK